MITAGIDMGTQSVKTVILKDGKVLARSKAFSGFETSKVAEETLAEALAKAKLTKSDLDHVTATGSGFEMTLASDSTVSMMGG